MKFPLKFSIAFPKDPSYEEVSISPRCPRCQKPLPYENISIVVVGSFGAGKSLYIAALVQQLKKLMQEYHESVQITALNQSLDRMYEEHYFDALRPRGIPSTQPARYETPTQIPLIYKLMMQRVLLRPQKYINLFFYDINTEICGAYEHQYHRETSQALANAAGIIFLLDPTEKLAEKNKSLPQHLVKGYGSSSLPWELELMRVEPILLRKELGLPMTIPIAVTLSKSDLFRTVNSLDKSYRFLQNPKYGDTIDLADLRAVHNEVKEAISQLGETKLLDWVDQRFKKASYFAVSATGNLPDGNGVFPSLTPYRCLDPLFWIMWKLDIVKIL